MSTLLRGPAVVVASVCVMLCGATAAQDFTPQQIRKGADIYGQNCAPCHGPRMLDPSSAFDLRTFPADQKSRFVRSVTKGLNSMPPWGDILKPEDVEALWAYVRAGER